MEHRRGGVLGRIGTHHFIVLTLYHSVLERFASHHRIRQVLSVQRLLMADKNHLILTAVGPDQIGLVEKISAFVSQHGCNIEDSKMAVFCGEFALILLISGESGALVKIANDHNQLEVATGLTLSIKTPADRKPAES